MEGKAELEQVHAVDARLVEATHPFAHRIAGTGDDGHLDHDGGDVLGCHLHVGEHALALLVGVVLLDREANFVEPGIAEPFGHLAREQIARRVHALVRIAEELVGAGEEGERVIEVE